MFPPKDLALWCSRLARQPVTLEVDGSSPFRVAISLEMRCISRALNGVEIPHRTLRCGERYAQIAQLVEQWTENPRVAGSIPALGTICGLSSSGRAPPCQGGGSEFEPRHPLHTVPWPSGKARVCKTLIRQFKSGRYLQNKKDIRKDVLFILERSLPWRASEAARGSEVAAQ